MSGSDTWPTHSEVPDYPGWRIGHVERRWQGDTSSWVTIVSVYYEPVPGNPTIGGQGDGQLDAAGVFALAGRTIEEHLEMLRTSPSR